MRYVQGVLCFFLAYFLWRRAFIFLESTVGLYQPFFGWVVLLAAVCAGAAAIWAGDKIAAFLQSQWFKYNALIKAAMILLSVAAGAYVAFLGLENAAGRLSGMLAMAGAGVAMFVFVLLVSGRCRQTIKYVRGVLAAFLDWRFVAAVLGLNGFAVAFLLLARQPFFWDNAGFWRTAADLSATAFSAPVGFFGGVLGSVFWHEYHFLPAVLPAYAMAVFNTSRMVFVLSVVNFYVVPFWAILYAACARTGKNGGFYGFALGAMALIFVPFLAVMGFLDVGGVALALGTVYLFFHCESEDGLVAGLLLCATVMFRRWYIFFAIGFLLFAAVYALSNRKIRRKLAMTLFVFGGSMLLFFQGYISDVLLRGGYGERYGAYHVPVLLNIRFVLRYFGLVPLLGALAYCLYRRKTSLLFPLVCGAVIFIAFIFVQQFFGMQHLLLFAAPMALVAVHLAGEKTRWIRLTALGVAALCAIAVFLPRAQPQTREEITGYALFPSITLRPPIREDAAQLSALHDFIAPKAGKVAVLASSYVLNSDLLAMVRASFHPLHPMDTAYNIIHTAQVDRRDGLPLALADIHYIVVAYPPQTHLDPAEQQVVVIPAQAMLAATPFSAAFAPMDETFTLRDGVRVYVFRRVRENTPAELEWLWREIGIEGVR
ncbi:MAG: hypothetical protein FWC07_05620 [Defluviitaleaceae bacterium]|nr:hypothetical protein [Defluviitaleaceae bacterium]